MSEPLWHQQCQQLLLDYRCQKCAICRTQLPYRATAKCPRDDGFINIRTFRPWPKVSFRRFLFIGHGRKPIFNVFRSSATAETHFLSFSAFRPRPKLRIYLFLIFRRGGNTVFLIFCFSAAAEMKFLLFFTRPPRRKAYFQHFLAFSRG